MQRRARNIVSRSRELSALAADLLDQGRTDAEVAAAISERAGERVRPATVAAFRKRDYARVEAKRLERREAAASVEMILSGAAGTYAQAGQELLARQLYEILTSGAEMSPQELIGAGKTFAKIREIEIAQLRAEIERNRSAAADAIKTAVGRKASGEEIVEVVDRVMGIRK